MIVFLFSSLFHLWLFSLFVTVKISEVISHHWLLLLSRLRLDSENSDSENCTPLSIKLGKIVFFVLFIHITNQPLIWCNDYMLSSKKYLIWALWATVFRDQCYNIHTSTITITAIKTTVLTQYILSFQPILFRCKATNHKFTSRGFIFFTMYNTLCPLTFWF